MEADSTTPSPKKIAVDSKDEDVDMERNSTGRREGGKFMLPPHQDGMKLYKGISIDRKQKIRFNKTFYFELDNRNFAHGTFTVDSSGDQMNYLNPQPARRSLETVSSVVIRRPSFVAPSSLTTISKG